MALLVCHLMLKKIKAHARQRPVTSSVQPINVMNVNDLVSDVIR